MYLISKRTVVSLFFIFGFGLSLFSLNDDRIPAEIKLADGQVKKGFVEHESYYEISDGIVFYTNELETKMKIEPMEISNMTLRNNENFESFFVKVDKNTDKRMLHRVNEGAINLYILYERTGKRYFVKSVDSKIEELEQHISYIDGKKKVVNGFRTVLARLMYSESDLVKSIYQTDFKFNRINELITYYNNRHGGSKIYTKTSNFQIDFALSAAYSQKMNISGYSYDANTFGLNAGLIFSDPNFSKVFSGHAGFAALNWKQNLDREVWSTIEQQNVILDDGTTQLQNVLVDYAIPSHERSNFLVGLPIFVRMNKIKSEVSLFGEFGFMPAQVFEKRTFDNATTESRSYFNVNFLGNVGIAFNPIEKMSIVAAFSNIQGLNVKAEYRF